MSSATKMFAVRPKESELIHSPFYPAEVRAGDPLSAVLSLGGPDGKPVELAAQVWRISPLGVEIACPEGTPPLTVGSEVSLHLRLGRQDTSFDGLVVADRHQEGGQSLIGIRWHQATSPRSPQEEDRRAAARWMCGPEFLPTGVAPNPLRFNDFIHFRIKELSTSGMQLVTSLRNKLLVPGMKLESTISFPMIGQIQVPLRIVHARILSDAGKEYLALGAELTAPDERLHRLMGEYIMQFGSPTTLEELRKAGLRVRSTLSAVDFSFVRTKEEYRQVLELRKLAYVGAGKLPADIDPLATGDIYDTRARILIARYRGQVVGSLRMMFHGPEDRLEHEEYVKLPPDFPRKDELVEVTRVCTHPDYRRSDLLLGLVKQAVLSILESGRMWALGSAVESLMPLYERMGARRTELVYSHQTLGGHEHIVFLCDLRSVVTGAGMDPITWNIICADIFQFMDANALIHSDPVASVRLGLYRLFKPLAHLARRRMSRPRKA